MPNEVTRVPLGDFTRDAEELLERVRHGAELVVEDEAGEVAVIKPPKRIRHTEGVGLEADRLAFRASAGSMKDLIDADALLEEIYAERGDSRPDVEL